MSRGSPDEVDRSVGARIRTRRQSLGMSQGALGSAIGVTFQQVQRYENGSHRMPIGRLTQIAAALGCTTTDLMDQHGHPGSPLPESALLESNHGLRLARAFLTIPPGEERKKLLELAEAMAKRHR